MMDGMGMMGMMIFMFLFGLLLIVLFVLIVVALVKWLWGSKMPFLVSDRENAFGNFQKTVRQRRDRVTASLYHRRLSPAPALVL